MHALELLLETAVLADDTLVTVRRDWAEHLHLDPLCVPGMRVGEGAGQNWRARDLLAARPRLCTCFADVARYPVTVAEAHTVTRLLHADAEVAGIDPVEELRRLRVAARDLSVASVEVPHLGPWVAARLAAFEDRASAVQETRRYRVAAGRRVAVSTGVVPGGAPPLDAAVAAQLWDSAQEDRHWYRFAWAHPDASDSSLLGLVCGVEASSPWVTVASVVAQQPWFVAALAVTGVGDARSRDDVELAASLCDQRAGRLAVTLAALDAARI